jgi:hypothetical protein
MAGYEAEENPFWAFFEDGPFIGEDDAEMNSLIGLIGIIVGHVGSLLSIVGYLYPAFLGGIAAISWSSWIFMGLMVASLGFQVWGLLTWIWADANENWATTLRSWRTNLVGQGVAAVMAFLGMSTFIVVAVINANFLAVILSFGLIIGGFVLCAAGLVLIYWLKDLYFNIDPEGMMRYYEGWSFFDTDEDWEEPMGDEEEEMAEEEMPAEEEMTAEEEW